MTRFTPSLETILAAAIGFASVVGLAAGALAESPLKNLLPPQAAWMTGDCLTAGDLKVGQESTFDPNRITLILGDDGKTFHWRVRADAYERSPRWWSREQYLTVGRDAKGWYVPVDGMRERAELVTSSETPLED